MNSLMEYKGYHAKIEYSANDCALIGTVCWINDSITFEGESLPEITQAFHEAIDDYLDFCNEVGKIPDKEFKGSFNVRINPELHRKLATYAAKNDTNINQAVTEAIERLVASPAISNEKRLCTLEASIDLLWKNYASSSQSFGSVDLLASSKSNKFIKQRSPYYA